MDVAQTQAKAPAQAAAASSSWLKKKLKKKGESARKMDGWILGETLGMGGYSKVKLGLNEKTGEKAALKIMFSEAESGKMSESKLKQLTRELAVMTKVAHENVIQLIEYNEEAEYPNHNGAKIPCILVVLEFAPGGELFDYLMFTGRFDEKATRTYFHQFLSGLKAIHAQGICHRDLKPENLLLDAECNLKIADFGFATEYKTEDGAAKKMQTACGTRGYLAPELLKGKKYTHLCDVFAVGIIMFTTFSGFPPFQNAVDSDWWWEKLSKGWKYFEMSKRLQDPADVAKHVKASKNKLDLFWKAHERTVLFPAPFKQLIERTLHPMPSCRFDIPDIEKTPWYNGETYSQVELKHFLSARVAKVKAERVDKIKKQVQESPEQRYSDNMRPLVAGVAGAPLDAESEFAKRGKELDEFGEFAQDMETTADESFVQTPYNYRTVCPPEVIAARVEHVACEVGAKSSVDPKKKLTIVQVSVNFSGLAKAVTSVSFAVKQFLVEGEMAQDKPVYEVCFKRLHGPHSAFKKAVEVFLFHKTIMYSML